jgi:hypothetical protein
VRSELQHIRVELDNVEHTLEKVHDGIDHVLDALATVGGEGQGSVELTYALADLRAAYTVLENEIASGKREGGVS